MSRGPSPRSSRPQPEDPSIRRTWWLLSGAFFLLVLITAFRAIGGHLLDWALLVVVAVAAIAAIGHRNAVAGLEARGRAEAESFARILRGLSRSVSPDAIVSAIVDDLADGTASDHVVVVRRSTDRRALEATLVTRRAGVPSSTTFLPMSDLEAPLDRVAPRPVAVPVELERAAEAVAAGAVSGAPGAGSGAAQALADDPLVPERSTAAAARAAAATATATGGDVGAPIPLRRVAREAGAGSTPRTGGATLGGGSLSIDRSAAAEKGSELLAAAATGAAAFARRAVREGRALLTDLGIAAAAPATADDLAPRSDILGYGDPAAITARIADRVRSVYGLSYTIAAPLPGEGGVVGAIVLSRRDREPWSDATRRLLVGAASEASAALVRANSLREATAGASTDPLTGLPNRRYFDEFCGLLARRRRAGDAVAVLMIDIDRFKRLNDTFGHPVGDEVLRAVAGAIATTVREEDVPARVGGEEFAVLLRNPGPGIAIEVGERVREAVRSLDLREHGVAGVTVSVGAANADGPDDPIPEIIERADQALLRAKRGGRDRVVAA